MLFKEYLWLIDQLSKEDKTFAELWENWHHRLEYRTITTPAAA